MTTLQDRIKKFNFEYKKKFPNTMMLVVSENEQHHKDIEIEKEVLEFWNNKLIQSIKEVQEETRKERDIAEKFLYSNLPLDLSIGTEFEVGGRYEDWGFIVMYKGNKISEGGTLEEAINNAKSKLSITNKENKK